MSDKELPPNIHRTLSWDEVDAALSSVPSSGDAGSIPALAGDKREEEGQRATAAVAAVTAADAPAAVSVCATGDGNGHNVQEEAVVQDKEEGERKDGCCSKNGNDVVAEDGKGVAGGVVCGDRRGDVVIGDVGGDGGDVSGVPVIAVEASKSVANLVELATEQLARHEEVCLRSLEKVRCGRLDKMLFVGEIVVGD